MSQDNERSEIYAQNSSQTKNYVKYSKILISGVNKLLSDRDLCDVTIIVGERRFNAHRLVLSACSPYFRTMFKNNMIESKKGEVFLDTLDGEAVHMILECIYAAKLSIDGSTVRALLSAAHYLQITEIQCECCDHLKKHLNVSNCLGTWEIADKYSCLDLLECTTAYIFAKIDEVVTNGEFLDLTRDRLVYIISKQAFNISSQEKLYEAVMRWVNHQKGIDEKEDRRTHLSNLLRHVDFSQMDPVYFVNVVSENPLIKGDSECLEYVTKAEDYISLHHHKDPKEFVRRTKRIKTTKEMLIVAGGEYSYSFEIYDPRLDIWVTRSRSKKLPELPFSLVSSNCKVYLLGCSRHLDGYHGYRSHFEYYDPSFGDWMSYSLSISTTRSGMRAVAQDGYIYIIGGRGYVAFGDEPVLNLVEKYDLLSRNWSECASLMIRRCCHQVTVLNGCIYALGGRDEAGRIIEHVERYDAQLDQWQIVTTMLTPRYSFGCASYDGYIYVVGGKDTDVRDSPTATGERYHPATDRWEPIPPMHQERSGHALVELDGLLYAVGGKKEPECQKLRTVEAYDPAKKSWSHRASMSEPRSGFGATSFFGIFS